MRIKTLLRFLKEEKAQVSAELIIIVAILVTLAIMVLNSMMSTAAKGNQTIEKKTDELFNKLDKINVED